MFFSHRRPVYIFTEKETTEIDLKLNGAQNAMTDNNKPLAIRYIKEIRDILNGKPTDTTD